MIQEAALGGLLAYVIQLIGDRAVPAAARKLKKLKASDSYLLSGPLYRFAIATLDGDDQNNRHTSAIVRSLEEQFRVHGEEKQIEIFRVPDKIEIPRHGDVAALEVQLHAQCLAIVERYHCDLMITGAVAKTKASLSLKLTVRNAEPLPTASFALGPKLDVLDGFPEFTRNWLVKIAISNLTHLLTEPNWNEAWDPIALQKTKALSEAELILPHKHVLTEGSTTAATAFGYQKIIVGEVDYAVAASEFFLNNFEQLVPGPLVGPLLANHANKLRVQARFKSEAERVNILIQAKILLRRARDQYQSHSNWWGVHNCLFNEIVLLKNLGEIELDVSMREIHFCEAERSFKSIDVGYLQPNDQDSLRIDYCNMLRRWVTCH